MRSIDDIDRLLADPLNAIPERWLEQLELRDEMSRLAEDMALMIIGNLDANDPTVWERYPGW